MSNQYSNLVRLAPSPETEGYTPSQMLRSFVSQTYLNSSEIAKILTGLQGKTVQQEKISEWSEPQNIIHPHYRKAFIKFVRMVCIQQIKQGWEKSFIECWARHSVENVKIDKVFTKHHQWIRQRYKQPILGETFSLSEIYVPIKIVGHGVRAGIEETSQVFDESYLEDFAVHGLSKSTRIADKDIDWIFIKGGPGSGKSALAITLADSLAKSRSGHTLYIRGTRLGGETIHPKNGLPDFVDDSIAITYLFEAFISSPKKRLTLIIDGLDEIGSQNHSNEKRVLDILEAIKLEAKLAENYGKKIRVIVFGRDTLTEVAAKGFKGRCRLFEMGDLSGCLGDDPKEAHCYSDDLRETWWNRYVSAKGFVPIDNIPKYLGDPIQSLFSISREPLLAFLIAKSAWPIEPMTSTLLLDVVKHIDANTSDKNRNEIYADIINRVRIGNDWKEDALAPLHRDSFLDVLQHIAVATWHNGTLRAVTLKGIEQIITSDETQRAFDRMIADLGHDTGPTLLTAFYYRFQTRQFEAGTVTDLADYEIEFTHKTFAEYLLTTFLFDLFEKILDAHESGQSDTIQATLHRLWCLYAMAGPQSREISRFALDEARIRFAKRPWKFWMQARELMFQIQSLRTVEMKSSGRTEGEFESPWVADVSTLQRLHRGSLVVMLLLGVLTRVHFEITGERIEYDEDVDAFESHDFQELSIPFTLGQFFDQTEMGDTGFDAFASNALSGIKWAEADFPSIFMSAAEILGSHFENCVFEAGTWLDMAFEDIVISDSNLRRSRFDNFLFQSSSFDKVNCRHSIFRNGSFRETQFEDHLTEQSEFRDVRFVECNFKYASFARSDFIDCEFLDCKFEACDFEGVLLSKTRWKFCSFEKMSFNNSDTDAALFEACNGVELVLS